MLDDPSVEGVGSLEDIERAAKRIYFLSMASYQSDLGIPAGVPPGKLARLTSAHLVLAALDDGVVAERLLSVGVDLTALRAAVTDAWLDDPYEIELDEEPGALVDDLDRALRAAGRLVAHLRGHPHPGVEPILDSLVEDLKGTVRLVETSPVESSRSFVAATVRNDHRWAVATLQQRGVTDLPPDCLPAGS